MFAYYIQRAFSPILASPYKQDNGDVSVDLISDRVAPFAGEMRFRVFNLASLTPLIDLRAGVETVTRKVNYFI